VEPELIEPVPVSPPSRRRRVIVAGIAILLAAAMLAAAWPNTPGPVAPTPVAAADTSQVSILASSPSSIDPAYHGNLESAAFVSQLYESLTSVSPSLAIEPALAESWVVEDGGKRVTFTLRPGLTFSNGTPLTASDVVHSWRRLFRPGNPSPLASLIAEVVGARALLSGASTDPATLGVRAEGDRTVIVDLERGGGDLPAIVSGAPFAVVPPTVDAGEIHPDPGHQVGSGGYLLDKATTDRYVLKANPRYWAGKPAIETVNLLTSTGGQSAVDTFAAGTLDVTRVRYLDQGWIAYDGTLGPSLRSEPALSTLYYGFDTTRPPFNDVRVRQAFAQAVDWRRLAKLDEPGYSVPATSMVPAGIPGTPAGDFLPPYDPAAARALLAEAGYPGGAGLAPVKFIGTVGGYDEGIVAMLEQNLGVKIDYSTMDYATYQERLATDPPAIWSTDWVADYPGPNDFLGVLLGTGSTANQGGWSSPTFDAANEEATSASHPADATAAYARAMGIVRDEVPVVPVSYGTSYSLVRDGLRGASQTGTGILRLAGLAWSGNP
jgi:oligopeptide transport system substrate-binding protein